ncbi:20625_t:CDS:2 [Gigaspora margarita]|uniref:20625_t:CDS:1 n=1 Tax=Gigaspora margarita TaxID=4874 RepID=A0ABN7VWS8_GIGMA|nr:20625_t:CDS:2 [Gigaspora margarita]
MLKNKILNELWDIIENAENNKLRKDIRTLDKWCRKLRKNKEKGIIVQKVKELERFIDPLKNHWGLKVVEPLLEEVTEEEWEEALKQTKSKFAPASRCLKEGSMPRKWKLSILYPILKQENWRYRLNNVRSILLIETFKKSVIRVLNNRLGSILKQRDILKERNFAGLQEEVSTGMYQDPRSDSRVYFKPVQK